MLAPDTDASGSMLIDVRLTLLVPDDARASEVQAKQGVRAKAKAKKTPRVFIGTPLREWKIHMIKDLEPSAVILPLVSEENYVVGKGKGKAVERPRVYIGDARWLHLPYTRMPVLPQSSRASLPDSELELDADGTFMPLEDLEEGMGWRWRQSVRGRGE